MPDSQPDIRSAARALIVRDDAILLLRKEYENGDIAYALPGGAQEASETLCATLGRECLEEIGCEVEVQGLACVAEYFRRRSSAPAQVRHLLECLFRCDVPADYVPGNGAKPDKHQVDVEWLPIARLEQENLSHPFLTGAVARGTQDAVYLGVFRDDGTA